MIDVVYKQQIIMFSVMTIVGMLFNPMNILAYQLSDLYISLTLFYGGLLMASNMIWAHEIIHYLSMGHFNKSFFLFGVGLSVIISIVLRKQLFVDDTQWLKRMISHHSTALTTTTQLLENEDNFTNRPSLYRLANGIVYNQKREISLMKSLL